MVTSCVVMDKILRWFFTTVCVVQCGVVWCVVHVCECGLCLCSCGDGVGMCFWLMFVLILKSFVSPTCCMTWRHVKEENGGDLLNLHQTTWPDF